MELEIVLAFVTGLAVGVLIGGILVMRFMWKAIKNIATIGTALVEESAKQQTARQQAEVFAQVFQGQDPH